LDESVLTAARDQAVKSFADWEREVKEGESIEPSLILQRLKLSEGNGRFRLNIAQPGNYVVFEGCSEVPLHIASGGDNVRPSWQGDYHGAHEHNDEVTSVGISQPGTLNGDKLNAWIGDLLRNQGGDIYRMKGVLSVKGSDKRLVFQGVHMLFDAKFDRPWGDAPRVNTLVFIGKKLDRAGLTASFQACLA
jgi:G3E family GTPase